MKNVLFVLAFSVSTVFAASSGVFEKLIQGNPEHKCPEVELSEEQRESIKSIMGEAKTVIVAHKDVMHDLHAKVVELLYGLESAKEDTNQAISELINGVLSMRKIKGEAKLDILFDVLSPEQRVAAVRCYFSNSDHGEGHGKWHGKEEDSGGDSTTLDPEKD